MEHGCRIVSVDTWLDVLPQLIARLNTEKQEINDLLETLLSRVGRSHPQALIYPITVAKKSTWAPRHKAAGKILADMKKHDRKMVADGELVSDELIRVAVLWHEQWHEGLEEASRYYFGEKVRCVDIALRSVAFRRVGCCLVRSLILSLTLRVSFVCAEPQGYDRNFAAFAPYDA